MSFKNIGFYGVYMVFENTSETNVSRRSSAVKAIRDPQVVRNYVVP
jgi:hypothetical protein